MKKSRGLFAVGFFASVSACDQPRPDFTRQVTSPSGELVAEISGYQPRGTIEGNLTIAFSPSGRPQKPLLNFAHLLDGRAGWLDNHTFALVFDVMEPREFLSPVYPTGVATSKVEIVPCNVRFSDCDKLIASMREGHILEIEQFPEGSWPDRR